MESVHYTTGIDGCGGRVDQSPRLRATGWEFHIRAGHAQWPGDGRVVPICEFVQPSALNSLSHYIYGL